MESTHYWLDAPREDLAEEMIGKINAYYEHLRDSGRMDLWRRSIRTYRGLDPNGGWARSSAVTFGGEQGETVLLRINHYRSLIQHVHTLITGSRPATRPRASGDDRESIEQTIIAEQLLESDMAHSALGASLQRAALFALQWTEGWVYQAWDFMAGNPYAADPETGRLVYEGGITTVPVRPIDVIRDPWATFEGDERPPWLIYRRPRLRWDLIKQYGEHADALADLPSVREAAKDEVLFWGKQAQERGDTDRVHTYELWAPRSVALPQGRFAILAGDTLLDHGPLPFEDVPLHELWPDAEEDLAFGHSPTIDLLAPQQAYDSVVSTAATNHDAFGIQAIWARKGDDVDYEELSAGLRVLRTEEKPEPIQFTRVAEDSYRLAELYKREMETLIGVNSVARGDPEASLKSGAALALVHSMAVQFLSGFHGAYAKLIERVCGARLDIHRRFTKLPQKLEITGNDDRASVVEWSGESLSRVSRVVVEIANPLMQTSQGRMEIADRYVANGWIMGPEQYSMVLATGRAEPLYRRDRDELRLIRAENERIKTGQPVAALVTDRHTLHIREHSVELSSPDVRFDEAVAKSVLTHIQEHIDLGKNTDPYVLMAIGEPVPEAGPPGPGGGGGGGGGEPPEPMEQPAGLAGPPTAEALNAGAGMFGAKAKMPQMPTNPLTGESA